MGGKAGGSTQIIVGYNYYASWAGEFGRGPAFALSELIVDGESVWKPESPVLRSESANPYVFDVSGRGRVHVYWGTSTQTLSDPVLTVIGRDFSNMRGSVIVVFEDFLTGFERLSVPDVKLVYQRAADQTIVTGDAALIADGQVNPVAALAELLTSPRAGVNLPATRFAKTSWQALADALEADAASEYLSPFLSSLTGLRDFIAELNGYADTWFRFGTAGGLECGRFLQAGDEPDDLPVVTEHDLTDLPRVDPQGYADLDDRVTLSYDSRDAAWEEREVRFDTPLNRALNETDSPVEARRQWITRPDQAQAKAGQLGVHSSTGWDALVLSLREVRAVALGIAPGDNFIFDYSSNLYDYRVVCRATQVNGFSDAGGAVRITAETERNLGPKAYSPAVSAETSEADDEPEDLTDAVVLQATTLLAGNQPYRAIALAGRPAGNFRDFAVWFRETGSAAYVSLGVQAAYAVPVQLAAAYADTEAVDDETGNLEVTPSATTLEGDFAALPGTQTSEEIADDNLLLIVYKAADPTTYEVMTLKSIESPTGDDYPLHVLRARFGTERLSWVLDDPAFIIYRADLGLFNNGAFAGVAEASGTAYFKLQPRTSKAALELADATELELDLETQAVLDVQQVATPIAVDGGGAYPALDYPKDITLTSSTSGATIRYSKTAMPNSATEGSAYSGAISVDEDETLYAKAFKAGSLSSDALIATYTAS